MFLRESAYRAKEPQSWFNDLRKYLAGRNPELDKLLLWIELQMEFIRHDDESVMIDCANHEVVSRQLWALLEALIKDYLSVKRTFANVPRHDGFEAWHKISEPANEDKALARKELLTKVTNPRPAVGMDDLNKSLED